MSEFSSRLKALRHEAGLSQVALAQSLGISASAIGMYEQGRRKPDIQTVVALANAFGCSTDYLLGVTDVRAPKPDTDWPEIIDILHRKGDYTPEQRERIKRILADIVAEMGASWEVD